MTTQVLALLEVLQDRGLVSADELADRLEVQPRTVRRQIAALRELGIVVESVRGRYGGYRLTRGPRLPPVMLADDEAVAVALALAVAGDATAAGVPSAADRALVKLTRLLPANLRERVTAMSATTAVLPSRWTRPEPDPEITLTLADALRSRRRLRLEYARAEGASNVRDVDPYGLVVHARRWYLVGHDHWREDLRTFRVDRLRSAEVLPIRCVIPRGFDPVAHVLQTLTFDAWQHRTEVWLDAPAAIVRSRYPATLGTVESSDGGALLTSGADDLDGMARWLCSLPWRFEVHEPDALGTAVREHVRSLSRVW
ncbi:MAG: helix-turn-helix transcriptional regulator [Jatrophihabitans sp.]